MVTMWMHLNRMPHSALYLNSIAIVPDACRLEAKALGSQSSPSAVTCSRKQVDVRKTSCGARKSSVRTSCNSRGSSVIDAEPIADTSSWRVEPPFRTSEGEDLPGWQKVKGVAGVASEGAPPAPALSSNEILTRKFGDNHQDTVDVALVQEGDIERSAYEGLTESELGSFGSSSSSDEENSSSRCSRQNAGERWKQRSFFSRPDMIRWRLHVEGVRTPVGENHESTRSWRVSHQLQDVIFFLESLGLDSSRMMATYPLLSTCSVENIRAVVRFLESCKLRRKDVVQLLSNNPQLLGHSVEETFLPVVKFLLTEVGLREKDVGKVVKRCARLLTSSVDDRLRPTLRFLHSLGFTHMAKVVANNATLLASSVETRLIPKLKFLEGIGLSKEEAVQALIRFPAIFNYSIGNNLQPKYSYLVDDMGRGLDDLKAFPQYFGYSLEHRISPRYEVLKERDLVFPLADLLKPTDEAFYARFQHGLLQLC